MIKLLQLVIFALYIINNGVISCEINITIISKTSQPFRMEILVPNGERSEMMTFTNSSQNYTFETKGKGHGMCGSGIFDMWTFKIYEQVNDTIVALTNATMTNETVADDVDIIEKSIISSEDVDLNSKNYTSKWQKAPLRKIYQVSRTTDV